MSPSQRRPNASQPILACPKTCSSRLSSVPRPSRQSINCRTVGVRHLQGFQIDAFQIVPRHAKVCHTNRPKRQKKNVKKKNLFFFKQTTIVRSCGLPNYETKLIFFLFYFFFVLNQGPRNRLAHPVGWYRVFFVFFLLGFHRVLTGFYGG